MQSLFLRECPLDFRCMKAVSTEEVVSRHPVILSGAQRSRRIP
jgi:hypothetical protein